MYTYVIGGWPVFLGLGILGVHILLSWLPKKSKPETDKRIYHTLAIVMHIMQLKRDVIELKTELAKVKLKLSEHIPKSVDEAFDELDSDSELENLATNRGPFEFKKIENIL